ncbi:MAG: hypothetical protein HY820_35385 [Acidobacteria bacterium]|nr:hypothetical protein [Acidobacteriota bacterium]
MSWIENINKCRNLASGPGLVNLVAIVSGSSRDSAFWASALNAVKADVLSPNAAIPIVPLAEDTPAGNFLGTIKAWNSVCSAGPVPTTGLSLMTMVFGQGRRFSPFTQTCGNRKAAFPTPCRGPRSGAYLRTGDLALLYSSLWLHHLATSGFHGVLVKWGDEATIPSTLWTPSPLLAGVDLVRFVWKTRPTEVYAKEKEWFVLDEQTGLIERLIPRQPYDSLTQVLSRYASNRYSTAVNLGSLAVSYRFLEIAGKCLAEALPNPSVAADWDPFVMLLLLTADDEDPTQDPATARGLALAESRCPGLQQAIRNIRAAVRQSLGRDPRCAFLDFGEALWIDLGLHSTLRNTLDALIAETPHGQAVRAFFGVPEQRDTNRNIVVDSSIAPGARIHHSLILDSTILSPATVADHAVIVGSRLGQLQLAHGGAALFSAANDVHFSGPNAVAFRAVERDLTLPAGGRHTTFFAGDAPFPLRSNESIQKYEEAEYMQPILDNPISFQAAGARAATVDPWELEDRWSQAWRSLVL